MATKLPNRATVREMLARAAATLESRREAELVTGLALRRSRAWLIAHDDAPVDGAGLERFDSLVRKRAEGVPIAYLAGSREFYGRDFLVDESVLIPRPETEHLVEWALALDLPEHARVVDVGTGSGCIALTLAAERPGWSCSGTEVSKRALAVAEANRKRLGLDTDRERTALVHGHLLEPYRGPAPGLIVSNPPYVAEDDPHLDRGDVRFEPRIALSAGPDDLAVIRELIAAARARLAPGGWLLIEHGHDQAAATRELFSNAGFERVESKPDLAGIERITGGRAGQNAS